MSCRFTHPAVGLARWGAPHKVKLSKIILQVFVSVPDDNFIFRVQPLVNRSNLLVTFDSRYLAILPVLTVAAYPCVQVQYS